LFFHSGYWLLTPGSLGLYDFNDVNDFNGLNGSTKFPCALSLTPFASVNDK